MSERKFIYGDIIQVRGGIDKAMVLQDQGDNDIIKIKVFNRYDPITLTLIEGFEVYTKAKAWIKVNEVIEK